MSKREEEAKLRQNIGIGFESQKILNNPLVVEYFENAKEGIMQKLQQTEVDEERERELVRMLKVLAHFEADFKKKIKAGNKANSLLKQLLERMK